MKLKMFSYRRFIRFLFLMLLVQFVFILVCLSKLLNISNFNFSDQRSSKEHIVIIDKHEIQQNVTKLNTSMIQGNSQNHQNINWGGNLNKKLNIIRKNGTEAKKYELIHCPKPNQTLNQYFTAFRSCAMNTSANKDEIKFLSFANKSICKNNPFLLILVHSYHDHVDKRMAIRETWGSVVSTGTYPGYSETFSEVILVFIVGIHTNNAKNGAIHIENEKHGDIIKGDFKESYKNLTLKHLFGLKFIVKYCSTVKYIVKMDDDIILHIPSIIRYLQNGIPKNTIIGPVSESARVDRQKRSKWFLTCDEYPLTRFPPYVSGAAYILDIPIAHKLLQASHCVPQIYLDDTYVTGFLAKVMDISHLNPGGFTFMDFIRKPTMTFCDDGHLGQFGK